MSLKQSMMTVTRQSKFARLSGVMASKLAKANNDPLYSKMIKFKHKYIQYKKQVQRKYAQRAKTAAKAAIR